MFVALLQQRHVGPEIPKEGKCPEEKTPHISIDIGVLGYCRISRLRERERERAELHHLADENFVGMRTIHISSIKESNSTMHSISDEFNHLLIRLWSSIE
jgi:hypothetical protein